MDKREILQKIIDENGECEVLVRPSKYDLCRVCPMSRLKQRDDGTYYSCWDSILSLSDIELWQKGKIVINDKYLAKAIEILQDITIDDILSGEPLVKDP